MLFPVLCFCALPFLFPFSSGRVVTEEQVIDFIAATTVVGIVPLPHALVVRRYQPSPFTSSWFSTYLWGLVFVRNSSLPLADTTHIRLFEVEGMKQQQEQQQQEQKQKRDEKKIEKLKQQQLSQPSSTASSSSSSTSDPSTAVPTKVSA